MIKNKKISPLDSDNKDHLSLQDYRKLKLVPWSVSVQSYIEHAYLHDAREIDVIMAAGESKPTVTPSIERIPYHQRFVARTLSGKIVAIRHPQPLLSAYYHASRGIFTDSLGIITRQDPLENIVREAVLAAGYALQNGYSLAQVYLSSPPSIPQLQRLLSLNQEEMEGYKRIPALKFFTV